MSPREKNMESGIKFLFQIPDTRFYPVANHPRDSTWVLSTLAAYAKKKNAIRFVSVHVLQTWRCLVSKTERQDP